MSSEFTGLNVPAPMCRVRYLQSWLFFIFLNNSSLKWNEAVGAATEPISLANTLW